MIQEENVVSYYGDVCTKSQAENLWKHLERYTSWAMAILDH
jgi:hypothetical protein